MILPPAGFLAALAAVAAVSALPAVEWPPRPWNLLGLALIGLGLALAGAALSLSSPLALLAAPAYGWWVQRSFIEREERLLEERFGDAYRAYCLRVRRWV